MRTRTVGVWFVRAALSLATFPVVAAVPDTVLGHVDGVTETSSGAVVLTGWACWKGWSWTSPQVDAYAGAPAGQGGAKLGVYWTDQSSEQAVSEVCETTGINHRFSITLNISMRQQFAGQKIYVYGYAYPGLGSNVLLDGSGLYTVPAAPATQDTVYYIHADRLGSNVVMTDSNAKVVNKTDYKAYGEAIQGEQKAEAPGYTGHYEDPLTGLTYMQARYYDADLGRFISVDPAAAVAGDLNGFGRYSYANNNPIAFVDPDGRAAVGIQKNYLNNGSSSAVDLAGYTVTPGAGGGSGWNSAGVSFGSGGVGHVSGGGGSSVVTLPTTTATAIAPPRVAPPQALPWTIPRFLAMPPNPVVVFILGLTWPGDMAPCQEPSCMPALHYNEEEPTYPVNPNSPEAKASGRFRPVRGTRAKVDNQDGSVWEKDYSSHGGEQWKRWPNVKSWEAGETPQSIWDNTGKIRK